MKKLLLLCMLLVCGSAWAENSLKIITLQHRFAQDILPTIQPLVGADGMASAVGDRLLIRTTPGRMAEIEQVIAMLDIERKNLRITISRNRSSRDTTREVGVAGSVRHGDVVVRIPDRAGRVPRDVAVDLEQHDATQDERGSEFVNVLEGEGATIGVGQSVPFTETWVTYTRHYAQLQQAVQFRDITTGFFVRARAIGDAYELEVAPRISSLSGGMVVFESLSTTVRVHAGEWFDLGGTMQARDEVSREILSGSSVVGQRQSQLWIMLQ